MSSDIAIRCEGLSKRYRIGEQERYKALRDVIADTVAAPFRRLRSAFAKGNGNADAAFGVRLCSRVGGQRHQRDEGSPDEMHGLTPP